MYIIGCCAIIAYWSLYLIGGYVYVYGNGIVLPIYIGKYTLYLVTKKMARESGPMDN